MHIVKICFHLLSILGFHVQFHFKKWALLLKKVANDEEKEELEHPQVLFPLVSTFPLILYLRMSMMLSITPKMPRVNFVHTHLSRPNKTSNVLMSPFCQIQAFPEVKMTPGGGLWQEALRWGVEGRCGGSHCPL